jgi:caa(3)-type oxidase subunit IV
MVEVHPSRTPSGRVFAALLVLTGLEYGLAGLPLRMGHEFLVRAAGLGLLASLYAFLVAWYFMHLKSDRRWICLMLVPVGLLTIVVLAGLTPDIAYHQFGFYQSTAVADD